MLYFTSQNGLKKKKIPTGPVYSKKQTRVTANQQNFKSGLIWRYFKKFLDVENDQLKCGHYFFYFRCTEVTTNQCWA